MFEFRCWSCGAHMQAPESLAFRTRKCPSCRGLNTIPRLHSPAEVDRAAGIIVFTCEFCGKGVEVPPSRAGQAVECPTCTLLNHVPRLGVLGESARAAQPRTPVPPADAPTPPADPPRETANTVPPPKPTGHHSLAEQTATEWAASDLPSPIELAEQVAAEWADIDPAARECCLRCLKGFAVVGPVGVKSFTCPHCGYVPEESYVTAYLVSFAAWRRKLEGLAIRRAAQLTQPALAGAGLESSVVRIQCRCSSCGTASETPPGQAGQEEICPECGRRLTAADRLASELIAFDAGATTPCVRCKTSFSVMQFGMTCPHCGNAPAEKICKGALKLRRETMGDWREIKRLGELLDEDSVNRKVPRFACPFCKSELPSSLAERNFAHVACPRCNHAALYVYNGEAFESPRECQRIVEFRLEKRKNAEEKARARELAEAGKGIATGTQPEGGRPNGGYVYALVNSTMPGLVKVGKTEREPDQRAKELSVATGIPIAFVVAYAELFKDCSAAEGYVHALLEQKGFRVAQNREFFCAPVKAAIQAIIKAKEREDRSGGVPPEAGTAG